MKVLLISTLYLKRVGNQALTNTLLGLAEAGHDVVFLQIRGEEVQPEAAQLHARVSVRHYSVLPRPARRLMLKLFMGAKAAERSLAGRFNRTTEEEQAEQPSAAIDYHPAAPQSLVQVIGDKAHWLLFQAVAVWQGWRVARREGVDAIYGYEVWGAPAASVLGRIVGLPVVTRFQGTFLRPMLGSRRLRLLFFDHVLAMRSRADLVIMTNDGTRGDEVLRILGVPDERVLFVSNGVSKDGPELATDRDAARRQLGLPLDAPMLLTVSKLAYWKRVDRSVRILPAVVEAHPHARLVVIGDGPERARLERLAGALGVSRAVTFAGAVPHAEVARYYRACDIFLSLYDLSNRGNPVLEAMVAGCCIVTLADGSVDDLLMNGESGVLVDPDRLDDELPKNVAALLGDPDRRALLGAAAKRAAGQRLATWEERRKVEVHRIEAAVRDHRAARRGPRRSLGEGGSS